MNQGSKLNEGETIDRAWVAKIAAEVLKRLRAESAAGLPRIEQRVVDVAAIREVPPNTTVVIRSDAVVTPAARDEAQDRGVQLNKGDCQATKPRINTNNVKVDSVGSESCQRAAAFKKQLGLRGIKSLGCEVMLSDQPARDVHQQTQNNHRAVMIHSTNDVDRFASELDPTVWVIDMGKANLITAVNIAARIAKLQ